MKSCTDHDTIPVTDSAWWPDHENEYTIFVLGPVLQCPSKVLYKLFATCLMNKVIVGVSHKSSNKLVDKC